MILEDRFQPLLLLSVLSLVEQLFLRFRWFLIDRIVCILAGLNTFLRIVCKTFAGV